MQACLLQDLLSKAGPHKRFKALASSSSRSRTTAAVMDLLITLSGLEMLPHTTLQQVCIQVDHPLPLLPPHPMLCTQCRPPEPCCQAITLMPAAGTRLPASATRRRRQAGYVTSGMPHMPGITKLCCLSSWGLWWATG